MARSCAWRRSGMVEEEARMRRRDDGIIILSPTLLCVWLERGGSRQRSRHGMAHLLT